MFTLFLKSRPGADVEASCLKSNAATVGFNAGRLSARLSQIRDELLHVSFVHMATRSLAGPGLLADELQEKLGDGDPSRSEPDLFQCPPCLSSWARREQDVRSRTHACPLARRDPESGE